jgi:hypothetical protein
MVDVFNGSITFSKMTLRRTFVVTKDTIKFYSDSCHVIECCWCFDKLVYTFSGSHCSLVVKEEEIEEDFLNLSLLPSQGTLEN